MVDNLILVSVTVHDRNDGGLTVFSNDLPGLAVSGPHADTVMADTVLAIEALCFLRFGTEVEVKPMVPFAQSLAQARPCDIHMHVTAFAVVLKRAA